VGRGLTKLCNLRDGPSELDRLFDHRSGTLKIDGDMSEVHRLEKRQGWELVLIMIGLVTGLVTGGAVVNAVMGGGGTNKASEKDLEAMLQTEAASEKATYELVAGMEELIRSQSDINNVIFLNFLGRMAYDELDGKTDTSGFPGLDGPMGNMFSYGSEKIMEFFFPEMKGVEYQDMRRTVVESCNALTVVQYSNSSKSCQETVLTSKVVCLVPEDDSKTDYIAIEGREHQYMSLDIRDHEKVFYEDPESLVLRNPVAIKNRQTELMGRKMYTKGKDSEIEFLKSGNPMINKIRLNVKGGIEGASVECEDNENGLVTKQKDFKEGEIVTIQILSPSFSSPMPAQGVSETLTPRTMMRHAEVVTPCSRMVKESTRKQIVTDLAVS
jgi:hypothetical protein